MNIIEIKKSNGPTVKLFEYPKILYCQRSLLEDELRNYLKKYNSDFDEVGFSKYFNDESMHKEHCKNFKAVDITKYQICDYPKKSLSYYTSNSDGFCALSTQKIELNVQM